MKRIMAKQSLEAEIWLYSFHICKRSSVWVWMCGGYVYTRLCVWMPMNVCMCVVLMTVTDTFVCHAIPYFLRSDLSLNLKLSTLAGQQAPQIPLSLPPSVRITYILSYTVFCGCWGPKFRSPCCITLSLYLTQVRFYLLFLLICHRLYLEFKGVLFCFALEATDTYIEKDWRGSLSFQLISPLSVWVYGMKNLRDVKTVIKNVFVNRCMGIVLCAFLTPCLNQVYILALAVCSQKVIRAFQNPHSLLLSIPSVVSPWTLFFISFLLLLWENSPCLLSKFTSPVLALCPYDKFTEHIN